MLLFLGQAFVSHFSQFPQQIERSAKSSHGCFRPGSVSVGPRLQHIIELPASLLHLAQQWLRRFGRQEHLELRKVAPASVIFLSCSRLHIWHTFHGTTPSLL